MAPQGKVFLLSHVMNESGCDTVKNDFVSTDTAPLGLDKYKTSSQGRKSVAHGNHFPAA